jgi:hypothetical protein
MRRGLKVWGVIEEGLEGFVGLGGFGRGVGGASCFTGVVFGLAVLAACRMGEKERFRVLRKLWRDWIGFGAAARRSEGGRFK